MNAIAIKIIHPKSIRKLLVLFPVRAISLEVQRAIK